MIQAMSLAGIREVFADGLRDALDGKNSQVAVLLRQLVAEVVDPNAAAWSAHLAHVTDPAPVEAPADVLELTSPPRDLRKVLP